MSINYEPWAERSESEKIAGQPPLEQIWDEEGFYQELARRDQNCSPIAHKASVSLRRREMQVIKEWLESIIDDLDLMSLETFPTEELTSGFPLLVSSLTELIKRPRPEHDGMDHLQQVAACLATLRKEGPAVTKLIDDYALLKQLLFEAAVGDLRSSDLEVLKISQRLDEGFHHIFKAGLEAFMTQHSLGLQRQANTDALTGLFNLRYFRQQLQKNLELYKRYHIPFSLLMLDLDNLKQLNDCCGHGAGDHALQCLGAIMTREKRETDIAVRYGGDEFYLLLPSTVADEAENLGRRITRQAQELNLKSGGREITGVSIGVVSCPDNGTDESALSDKADKALYLAKTIGGSSVASYREFQFKPISHP